MNKIIFILIIFSNTQIKAEEIETWITYYKKTKSVDYMVMGVDRKKAIECYKQLNNKKKFKEVQKKAEQIKNKDRVMIREVCKL